MFKIKQSMCRNKYTLSRYLNACEIHMLCYFRSTVILMFLLKAYDYYNGSCGSIAQKRQHSLQCPTNETIKVKITCNLIQIQQNITSASSTL